MDAELQSVAKGYIGLLQRALALRAKAAPTQQLSYEPLVEAMTQLALCLRNANTTSNELTLAVYLASSVWTEWHDDHTDFWNELLAQHAIEWDNNDLITSLGIAI